MVWLDGMWIWSKDRHWRSCVFRLIFFSKYSRGSRWNEQRFLKDFCKCKKLWKACSELGRRGIWIQHLTWEHCKLSDVLTRFRANADVRGRAYTYCRSRQIFCEYLWQKRNMNYWYQVIFVNGRDRCYCWKSRTVMKRTVIQQRSCF